jgi:NAD(P)-dependent dehydrogenase (short-subunit alcohol dehydrogenase family)
MKQLSEKTAVISGTAEGIGSVACREFCEEGARVTGSGLVVDGGWTAV